MNTQPQTHQTRQRNFPTIVYALINAEAAFIRVYHASDNLPIANRALKAARELREQIDMHCPWFTGYDLKPTLIKG